MNNARLEQLCELADSLYQRGYAHGSTGNLSLRINDQIWITPTGKPLKGLTPGDLACVDLQGAPQGANRPSKEWPFHLAIYRQREDIRAIVHLHSLNAVALSCLAGLDMDNPIPPITPYYFMRVAPLAVLPYLRPGSEKLAEAVENAAPRHNCMLLRNHGLICAGSTLNEAGDRAEELEQTARLYFLLRGEQLNTLSREQVDELANL
jgi:ribulose-5-phosphate 4-epimerase/fuculose-1-phosphate aldolase